MSTINVLNPPDIPRALELSTAAGWNQLKADWQRLIDLWPNTCFAFRDAGRILGTATLAVYGQVGWVGMVLVDPATRGRGVGGQLFDHACEAGRGLEFLGLDATDLGRPVYEKRGFIVHSGIDRWILPCGMGILPMSAEGGSPDMGKDAHANLVDRSALLNHLTAERDAIGLGDPNGIAYAFARPGRTAWHIGPVVADDPSTGQALVQRLLHQIASRGGQRAIIDIPAASPLSTWLTGQGLAPARNLLRMFRPLPSQPVLTTPQVLAAAGFELG